jgi:hypothetical protein
MFCFGFLILHLRDTVTGVKPNRRILLVLLAVAFVVGLTALVWHGPREPRYQGKSLSEWLKLYRPMGPPRLVGSKETADAVRHIGTNALPFLVSWIEEYQELPPWRARLRRYASKPTSRGRRILLEMIAQPEFRAARACWGFEILGETAAPAIPDLVRVANHATPGSSSLAADALALLGKDALVPLFALMTNSACPIRDEAMWSVGQMHYLGTNAHPAVVLLIQHLHDPHLATIAANVLGVLGLESNISVPALVECTHSSNQDLQRAAAISLGRFGSSARPAVPELLKMSDDPSVDVRIEATAALQKIAPEILKRDAEP